MPNLQLDQCSIARTLDIVGEKWTLLIIRNLWLGQSKFSELESQLGAPRNLLAKRLRTLQEHGIIGKVEYKEPGARTRSAYQLTPAGQDLLPILAALNAWGDAHNPAPGGPFVHLTSTEGPVRVGFINSHGAAVPVSTIQLTQRPH